MKSNCQCEKATDGFYFFLRILRQPTKTLYLNKKVLLRECKRHTARGVASARYAGGGVPHPVMVWEYPI